MNAILAWPVLVVFAAGFGTLYLVSYLLQYRKRPGATWFIVTLLAQALFCFAYGIGLTVFDPTLRFWLEILALVGLGWLGVPFLGFAIGYTGRGELVDSWGFRGLLLIPVATTVLLPLNPWHGLFLSDFELSPTYGVATATYTFEPLLFASILAGAIVVVPASLLLFDTVLSYGPLYRKEAAAVALSPVAPVLGLLPWLFAVGPAPALNTIAIGLLPHVVLDTYAFARSGMFEFSPATNRAAERSANDDLPTPLVVLETGGRIVDCNEAARRVLGLDLESVITTPIDEVLGLDLDSVLDAPADDEHQFTMQTDGRRRVFTVRSSPLTQSNGAHVGYTLLFQDVTASVQRKEQLSVLNRVLRHNLRNDLTVADGLVETARETTERPEVTKLLEEASDTLQELAATGEKARDIEQTVGGTTQGSTPVDLEDLLARLADRFETESPEATVRARVAETTGETDSATAETDSATAETDAVTVETDAATLESILVELIENAIVHGGESRPVVTVEATSGESSTRIAVADTGIGISDYEVESLQQADESALEHGSGLGLWVVKWAVVQLGGTLQFDADVDGTTVTVEFSAS